MIPSIPKLRDKVRYSIQYFDFNKNKLKHSFWADFIVVMNSLYITYFCDESFSK